MDPTDPTREASHVDRAPNSRGGHPGRWSVLVGPDSAKPTYTFQRQAIAVTPSLLRAGLRTRWSGEVVQLVGLEAAGVADVGEDRDAVGDGNADSDVALLVLGDAGHPGVYAVVQRIGACCKRTE
jgi:hypothetical protein